MAKWEKARCGLEVMDVNRAFEIAINVARGFPIDVINLEQLSSILSNKINDMLIACIGSEEGLSDYARREYREHIHAFIRREEPLELERMRDSLMNKVRSKAFVVV